MLWCVRPQQVPGGLVTPLAGKESAKGTHSPSSSTYSHQPGDRERERSFLLEEQSPCKAISPTVTEFRNGDQKGKAPGAC